MPIGVICAAAAVAVGGLLGTFLGDKLSDSVSLATVFGIDKFFVEEIVAGHRLNHRLDVFNFALRKMVLFV